MSDSIGVSERTHIVSVAQVVPVVWSDVFALDDVSEGKDDVRTQSYVDKFWSETRIAGAKL